jgi:hypothetical protein
MLLQRQLQYTPQLHGVSVPPAVVFFVLICLAGGPCVAREKRQLRR